MWGRLMVWGSCFYIMVSVAFFDGFGSAFSFSFQGGADSTSSRTSHYKEQEFLVIMPFLTITRQLCQWGTRIFPFLESLEWGEEVTFGGPRKLGCPQGSGQGETPGAGDALGSSLHLCKGTNAHFQQG